MKIGNIFKHFFLVLRHKNKVLVHCAKCGILWRGLMHDLSKLSPTEFFESAKYYRGNYSPISACRKEKGYSNAWLHHKSHNKHHLEYWVDEECDVPPLVPYPYAVECVCDKLAATKTYRGKNYDPALALWHWDHYGNRVNANPRTLLFIEKALTDLRDHGEKYILNKKYMKKTYKEICLDPIDEDKININKDAQNEIEPENEGVLPEKQESDNK